MTDTEPVTVEVYMNGVLIETRTEQRPYDPVRRAVVSDYKAATAALLNNANVLPVHKAHVRALNRLLRLIVDEVTE